MKNRAARIGVTLLTLTIGIMIGYGCNESAKQGDGAAEASKADTPAAKKVKRFGSVIGLKPEKKDYYLKLHAEAWPAVLDRIRKSNVQNYSIYMAELEGKLYLFSYLEYVGDDWDADMKAMADDEMTQKWWKETDPCQNVLPGTPEGDQWLTAKEVFHTD